MIEVHNETIKKIDMLAKKVDDRNADQVVQPDISAGAHVGKNPPMGHVQRQDDDPPTEVLHMYAKESMSEEDEPHPFQRPPRRVPGLKPVPVDLSGVELPYIEGLPDRTLRNALEGNYIQIDLFLENTSFDLEVGGALELVTGDNGFMACRPRRGRREVYNIISWLEAFENYTRLMANYHGLLLFNNMSAYKTMIIDFDRMYQWKSVAKFDMKQRGKKGGRSIDFQNIDILLANRIMNNTVMKLEATRCDDCGGYDHIARACPFRGSSGAQSRSAGRHSISSAPVHKQTSEKCFNWNPLRCYESNCWRLHICRGCGGNMPYKLCAESGPCAGKPAGRAHSSHGPPPPAMQQHYEHSYQHSTSQPRH